MPKGKNTKPQNTESDFKATPHFIAYFDILGYASMVQTDEDIEKISQIIHDTISFNERLNKSFQEISSDEKLWGDHEGMKHKVFSDNFCLCSEAGGLGILLRVEALQRILAEKGIFIRGSITHGNICFEKNFISGTGIIDAYKLENEVAIFPRVVVSEEFFIAVQKADPTRDRNHFDELGMIKRDFDGQFYVNYLGLSEPDDSDLLPLPVHKKLIEENLEKHANTPRIRQKYEWCKSYHNRHCEEKGFTDFLIE